LVNAAQLTDAAGAATAAAVGMLNALSNSARAEYLSAVTGSAAPGPPTVLLAPAGRDTRPPTVLLAAAGRDTEAPAC